MSGLFFPFLIILGVLIPILEYSILIKCQRLKRLENNVLNKSRFAYLMIGFRKERFNWEFVIYLRKIVLIVTSINFLNKLTKGLILQLVLIVALYLQIFRKPYQDEICNRLERISIYTSTLLINVWLYYSEDSNLSETKNLFAFFLAVIFQLFFYISWIKEFLSFSKKIRCYVERLKKNRSFFFKVYEFFNKKKDRSPDRKNTLRRFLEKLAKQKLN